MARYKSQPDRRSSSANVVGRSRASIGSAASGGVRRRPVGIGGTGGGGSGSVGSGAASVRRKRRMRPGTKKIHRASEYV